MRTMVKTVLAAIIAFVCIIFGMDGAMAAEGRGEKKVLIAYFSHSGNTRAIANQIHSRVGGDLFELQAADAYPAEYRACLDRAKTEQQSGVRPALSKEVSDMGSYDVVFIGYPNWWGTIPMPLFTFFERYDFSGKTLVPFCTHGGGGLGRSAQDIRRLAPNAAILEGLSIRGGSAGSAQDEISTWLDRIEMAN